MAKRIGVVLKYRMNQLARMLYHMHGYEVPEGYDFSKAVHPQEKLMFAMARESFEFWVTGSGELCAGDKP